MSLKKIKKYHGFFYILPWLIGLLLFKLYPVIYSFILSFTDSNTISPPQFIGLTNYIRMFSDKDFLISISVTFIYAFIEVPLKIVVSLLVAYILSLNLKGMSFFRTAYYIPTILGSNIAIAILWRYLFSSKGLINQFVEVFGAEPISWFGDKIPSLFVIILLRVWEFGSTMIVFLAGFKEVPKELHEAGEIDGCSPIKKFLKITLPMINPLIFFNFLDRKSVV